jgi:hypothetical protein
MAWARKVNWGRTGSVLAALATLYVGRAVAAAPWGPWSTAFLLVAPAVPAAVLWRAVDRPARFVLAGASAVVVDAVVAEVMLATGTWSLSTGMVAVAVVCALMWLGNSVSWNVMAGRRSSPRRGHRAQRERARSWSS